ncbi:MAG TPA: PXPV repeat protein [Puia sp.]|nr:PXPV repeat protein [Puia sp.]
MKKVIILSAVIASSLIATKGYSQVFVSAHVGFRVPGPRVYVAPAPVYAEPAPVYEQAPAYDGGYYAAPPVCEAEFPGYAYYDYPAWDGHYRDRFYFEHYRPYFERDHRAYFYGRRFDHERWEHERGEYGHDRGWDHDRGWGHDRGWDHDRGWGHDREWHRGRW